MSGSCSIGRYALFETFHSLQFTILIYTIGTELPIGACILSNKFNDDV